MTGKPQKVLFIGGVGRSGSTLIEKVLHGLDETFAVGETLHLWERGVTNNELCGCGEPFDQCPHWQAVGDIAFGGWHKADTAKAIDLRWRVDRSRRLPQIVKALRTNKPTQEQQEYLDYLVPVLLASSEAARHPQVLLESSKHLSTAAILALDPQIDLHILHVVRDPRGVAYSWTKQVKRPETDDDFMPVYSPRRSAFRWLSDNSGFSMLGRHTKLLRIRYEDFLQQPKQTVASISEFMQIKQPDLSFINGSTIRSNHVMHSVAGNPMRFSSDDITLRHDSAWEKQLAMRHKIEVSTICAPLLRKYGYAMFC